MCRYFAPDEYVATYRDVTPMFLEKRNIRYLLLDIDNTLAPYEQPEPDSENLAWFNAMREAGIKMAFVSNNEHARVSLFNEKIGIPMYPKAKKPLRCFMRAAMAELGAVPGETAIMGDQLFTDTWAGRRVGIRTIALPPIKDKRDLGTRLKRLLERPILRRYQKRKRRDATDE